MTERYRPQSPTKIPKAGWLAILKRALPEFRDDDVTDRAAALTYFGVLAIFPGMLVLVSILGLLGTSTVDKLLANLEGIAPGEVDSFLKTVVEQVQGTASTASFTAIAGIAIALWSTSRYVASFMRASNAIYDVDEGRPIWRTVPMRLAITLALVIMLILSAVIVVVTGPIARQVGAALGVGDAAVIVWGIAKWPVLLIIVVLMLTLLYKASPNVELPGLRWITPGGVVAVVIWLAASGLFALYVSFSDSYNKTYGSFSTVIVFLVWLWISNIAILLGLEFNSELLREREILAGMPESVEPYAELRDTRKLDEDEKRHVEQAERARRAAERRAP